MAKKKNIPEMQENPFITITNQKHPEYSSWVCTLEKPKVITVNTPTETINLSLKSLLFALKVNQLI